jgi:hypothetical protein
VSASTQATLLFRLGKREATLHELAGRKVEFANHVRIGAPGLSEIRQRRYSGARQLAPCQTQLLPSCLPSASTSISVRHCGLPRHRWPSGDMRHSPRGFLASRHRLVTLSPITLLGRGDLLLIVQNGAGAGPIFLEAGRLGEERLRPGVPLLDLREGALALDLLQPQIGIVGRDRRLSNGGAGYEHGSSG